MLPAAFLLDGRAGDARPPRRRRGRARRRRGPHRVGLLRRGRTRRPGSRARSRIWVEGVHDAALVERIWGDDLRVEGVVVEPLDGIDDLVGARPRVRPGPRAAGRRARRPPRAGQQGDPHRRARSRRLRDRAGHRPPLRRRLAGGEAHGARHRGLAAIPRGTDWKTGICAALRCRDPREMWRRVLGGVDSFADVEVPLLRAVEELIDFVTALTRGRHAITAVAPTASDDDVMPDWLIWLIAAGVLRRAPRRCRSTCVLLMFAGGAAAAASPPRSAAPVLLQVIVAIVATAALLGVVRPVARRHLHRRARRCTGTRRPGRAGGGRRSAGRRPTAAGCGSTAASGRPARSTTRSGARRPARVVRGRAHQRRDGAGRAATRPAGIRPHPSTSESTRRAGT